MGVVDEIVVDVRSYDHAVAHAFLSRNVVWETWGDYLPLGVQDSHIWVSGESQQALEESEDHCLQMGVCRASGMVACHALETVVCRDLETVAQLDLEMVVFQRTGAACCWKIWKWTTKSDSAHKVNFR